MSRILVVGAGLIGLRHAQRVAAHPAATLAGIVDPNTQAAAELDAPRFADLTDVNIPVDGVILATPTALHAPQTHVCAQKNWAVLVEKPIASTLADADSLQSLTIPILVGHHRRHHPKVKALKALLETGEIGTPITASLIWAMQKPDAYFKDNWRSTDGSPVLINLVHDLDLLAYFFGPPSEIMALSGTRLRDSTRIESGAIALRTQSGLTATISFSDNALSPWGFEAGTGENPNIGTTSQDMMWITGTKGAISFPSLTRWNGTDWSTPATPRAPLEATGPAPLDAQLTHFLDVIAGTAAPLCNVNDGRAALAAALEVEAQLTREAAV